MKQCTPNIQAYLFQSISLKIESTSSELNPALAIRQVFIFSDRASLIYLVLASGADDPDF